MINGIIAMLNCPKHMCEFFPFLAMTVPFLDRCMTHAFQRRTRPKRVNVKLLGYLKHKYLFAPPSLLHKNPLTSIKHFKIFPRTNGSGYFLYIAEFSETSMRSKLRSV